MTETQAACPRKPYRPETPRFIHLQPGPIWQQIRLLSIASVEASAELGAGPAFGSRKSMVVELSISHLDHIPDLELHVFAGQRDALFGDWVLRQQYNARFEAAMSHWPEICHTLPPEWWFIDPEQTIPTQFDLRLLQANLMRFRDETFWRQT